jgi:hypothetical protein
MLQPAIAFFEEGFGLKRRQSVALLRVITFLGASAVILSPGLSVMDTVDAYTSNIGIPLLALFEVFVFIFILKVSKGVKESEFGADMQIPRFFGFVITYITPLFLFAILGWWFYDQTKMWLNPEALLGGFLVTNAPGLHEWMVGIMKPDWSGWAPMETNQVYALLYMVLFFFVLVLLQYVAWPRMRRHSNAYRKALPPEELD